MQSEGETASLVGALAAVLEDRTLEVKRAAATAVKRASKNAPAATQKHMAKLATPLLKAAADKNSALKTASERAIYHLLRFHSGPDLMNQCAKQLDGTGASDLKTYAQRTLAKSAPDSGDEED
jgi:hypothetical protein